MKYRIKVITYKNGRKIYQPQYKTRFWWVHLGNNGEIDMISTDCKTRERALKIIDLHFDGNSTKQTIEFEYIKK